MTGEEGLRPGPALSRERAVAAMAENFVVAYLHVERGLLPARTITSVMDWRTQELLGPITPPPHVRPVTEDDYRHVRVSMPTPRRAHVSAVTRDAHGRWGGLVLELGYRPVFGEDRSTWMVTDLVRIEHERQLSPAAPNSAPELPRRWRLHDELQMTRTTLDVATLAFQGVAGRREAAAVALRDRVRSLMDDERSAAREVQLSAELRYVDTPRQVDPPAYLTALLGPPPTAAPSLERWRRAAGIVEAYRERWNVVDAQRPLGPSEGLNRHQALDRRDADIRLHELGFDVVTLERRARLAQPNRGLDID